jgi:CheY-like chemotaxis protein
MFFHAPVLIAEENSYLAIDLSNALEDMDGKVVGPASTLAEALQLLEQNAVAAAIVDCRLGDHDTISLTRILAQRGVPFVIQTSTPAPGAIAALHPDVPVLVKPVQPQALLTCLLDEMRKVRQLPPAAPMPLST